jgi:hypothetical protein
MKSFLIKSIPHACAILLFIVVSSYLFGPVWQGYELRQSDIAQWRGMSKEIADYRLEYGQEPLWTNSMFGGMPAYQISVLHHDNLLLQVDKIIHLGLPGPVGIVFMCMLGFYILSQCLKINPWLGIAMSVGFGLSSIHILYLAGGHASKVAAISYMAPTLGGLLLATRGRILLGGAVFALFFGLNIAANHLQMTYYLVIMLAAVFVAEAVRLVLAKDINRLAKATGVLAIAGIVGVLPCMTNLLSTYEYSKYTTRGKTELTISPDGQEREVSDITGLNSDYILDYNFGKGEIWSLAIPNAKGGESDVLANNKEALKMMDRQFQEFGGQWPQYWGEQRFTGGAFYFGAIIMALFVLGLIFSKDALKWPFLVLTLLVVFLCRKDMNGVNDFFIHHFPLYNKFRDSKMMLVLIQIMAPVMAMLFLTRLQDEELSAKTKKWIYGGIAGVAFIFILLVASPGVMGEYLSAQDIEQLDQIEAKNPDQRAQLEEFKDQLIAARQFIFKEDAKRTLVFVIIAAIASVAYTFKKIPAVAVTAVLGIAVMGDLWSIDHRYLNDEKVKGNQYRSYVKVDNKLIPHKPDKADYYILEKERVKIEGFDQKVNELKGKMLQGEFGKMKDKEAIEYAAEFGTLSLNSDFRVLSLSNPFNNAATSYFHKSLGGYHGAKLKRYQELIDFHIQPEMSVLIDSLKKGVNPMTKENPFPVLNMLNTHYIIANGEMPAITNDGACGNAWFVEKLNIAATANDEILETGKINPLKEAVVHESFGSVAKSGEVVDSSESITLADYAVNSLTYKSHSNKEHPAIFSEIYYPEGWKCAIDGQEVPAFRANYALRGAMVPAGDHTIEWSFAPSSFAKGKPIALIGSIILILGFLGIALLEIRKALKA